MRELIAAHNELAEDVEAKAAMMVHFREAMDILKKCHKNEADVKAYMGKEDGESALKVVPRASVVAL